MDTQWTVTALLDTLRAEIDRHHAVLAERLTAGVPNEPPPDPRDAETCGHWQVTARDLYRAAQSDDGGTLWRGPVKVDADLVNRAVDQLREAAGKWAATQARLRKAERRIVDLDRQVGALQVECDRLRPVQPETVPVVGDEVAALAAVIDEADAMSPRRLVGRLRWAEAVAGAVLAHQAREGEGEAAAG